MSRKLPNSDLQKVYLSVRNAKRIWASEVFRYEEERKNAFHALKDTQGILDHFKEHKV